MSVTRELLLEFQNKLLELESEEFVLLTELWNDEIKRLTLDIDRVLKRGIIDRSNLYKDESYITLLKLVKESIKSFAEQAVMLIVLGQIDNINQGRIAMEAILSVQHGTLKPTKVLENIGMSRGDLIINLITDTYPEVILRLTTAIIERKGWKEAFNPVLSKTLTIARTEQMYCYNESARESMKLWQK